MPLAQKVTTDRARAVRGYHTTESMALRPLLMSLYVCTQQTHATKRSPSGATAPHEPEDQAHINCKTHSGKAAEASGRHRTYGRDFGPPRQLGARNNIPLRNLNGLKGAMAQSRRSVCAVR